MYIAQDIVLTSQSFIVTLLVLNDVNFSKTLLADIFTFSTVFTKFDEVNERFIFRKTQHILLQESKIVVLFTCGEDWKAALPGPSVTSLNARSPDSSSPE